MSQSLSKFKLAIFWCGLFAIAFLLSVGGMELILRLALSRRFTAETGFPLVPSDVPGMGYRLASNHTGDGIQTDENGFRVRPVSALPIRHRILVLGDSISFGSGVPYANSYVPQLEESLQKGSDDGIAVWNAGVPGYNTTQEAAMLRRAGPLVHPDLVIVEFCMNDYLDAPTLTPGGTLDATGSSDGSRFSLVALLYRLRTFVFVKEKFKDVQKARPEWFPVWAHYIHSITKKPGWAWSKQALLSIRDYTSQTNARLLVVIFPVEQQLRLGDRTAQDDLIAFAGKNGIRTLDLYDSFRQKWRDGLYIDYWKQAGQFDKLHPNERGHALAAAQISAEIAAKRDVYLNGKPSETSATKTESHEELSAIR